MALSAMVAVAVAVAANEERGGSGRGKRKREGIRRIWDWEFMEELELKSGGVGGA